MIIGWIHPDTGFRVPLADFDALANIVPRGYLQSLVHKDRTDVRHSGTNVTITSGLGCPRKTVMQRLLKLHVDPTKMWAAHRGTWLHEQMGHALTGAEGWLTEESHPDACVFEGTLFGIKMSCKIDARRDDFSELWDYKFRSDFFARRIPLDGTAKLEDALQLNMARLLMEQATGRDLREMKLVVWVDSTGWKKTYAYDVMSEMAIGASRPNGSTYTVRELFLILDAAFTAYKSGEDAYSVASSVPKVGLTMYRDARYPSRSLCNPYCEIEQECTDLDGKM